MSVWNFCCRSSDVISQGNQWWSAKCRLFSQTILFCGFFSVCPWDRLRLLFFNWNLKKILKIFIIFAEISGSLTHSVPGCPCSKTSSPQCSPQLSRSSLFSGPSRRGAGVMYTGDTSMRVHECCCCCCNEDLLKLQVTRLVLCLRCWTTWRQKQKGEETRENARQVSCYVYVTKSDNHFWLRAWFRSLSFLGKYFCNKYEKYQKSLPRATIGSCVVRKRERSRNFLFRSWSYSIVLRPP